MRGPDDFVRDPDGYMVENLETHGETPAISGPGAGEGLARSASDLFGHENRKRPSNSQPRPNVDVLSVRPAARAACIAAGPPFSFERVSHPLDRLEHQVSEICPPRSIESRGRDRAHAVVHRSEHAVKAWHPRLDSSLETTERLELGVDPPSLCVEKTAHDAGDLVT
jgi:hypothetical protein